MQPGGADRFGVLVASGGAAWESEAVEAIGAAGPGVVLLRRCLDVAELLAAATTGAARVAVVSPRLPGLDADAISQLAQHGTRVLVLGDGREAERVRLERMGAAAVLAGVEPIFGERLRAVAALAEGGTQSPEAAPDEAPDNSEDPRAGGDEPGRVVAVWGPYGAAGRTTVAVGLAAGLARRGIPTLLLDIDPYGGAVAQHLGVTDEVSGLLAAARAGNAGLLEPSRLAGLLRRVGPQLRVLTGLPRPDRWREVRPAAVEQLLEQAARLGAVVVVDAGPGLEPGEQGAVSRDALVTGVVAAADVVVAVGSADPVGLARAARALADLADVRPDGAAYVVVNRWRSGLGWSREQVEELVGRIAPAASLALLPEDRAGADRALVAGRSLAECREGPLARAVAGLADRVAAEVVAVGGQPQPTRRQIRRRGLLVRR